MKKEIKMDENSKVSVVLTEKGADVINRYNDFLNKYASGDELFKSDYKENDVYGSELWGVMRIFYGENNKGTEKCFKEIRVFEEE